MEWWEERGFCAGWAGRAGSMSKADDKARSELRTKMAAPAHFYLHFFTFMGTSTQKGSILEIPFLCIDVIQIMDSRIRWFLG